LHWQRGIGRNPPAAAVAARSSDRVERTSPGLAVFFEGVSEDRSHAVLDLGPATGSSLGVYSRFARWVRFADLLSSAATTQAWDAARDSLPGNPERPYDLVLAWDILDRLEAEEREGLVHRLSEVSAPDARLFVVVATPVERPAQLLRFAITDIDRMRYESTDVTRTLQAPLLPSEVQRLLIPFQVMRAFSSEVGLREYFAKRRATPSAAR